MRMRDGDAILGRGWCLGSLACTESITSLEVQARSWRMDPSRCSFMCCLSFIVDVSYLYHTIPIEHRSLARRRTEFGIKFHSSHIFLSKDTQCKYIFSLPSDSQSVNDT
jgi:hypothetical protein